MAIVIVVWSVQSKNIVVEIFGFNQNSNDVTLLLTTGTY